MPRRSQHVPNRFLIGVKNVIKNVILTTPKMKRGKNILNNVPQKLTKEYIANKNNPRFTFAGLRRILKCPPKCPPSKFGAQFGSHRLDHYFHQMNLYSLYWCTNFTCFVGAIGVFRSSKKFNPKLHKYKYIYK